MKVPFKTLSLAVAVATATAGSSLAISQPTAFLAGNSLLGDMAIVPYYTVRAGWSTGISIINSSASTQVVKVRFRRGSDSMDAMDFNIVLSPFDHFGGYIALEGDDADGAIRFYSGDNSCTVPAVSVLQMPGIYREGADEGYIEIISMAQPYDEEEPIAVAAKHTAAGVPLDCARVQDNFLKGNNASDYGNSSSILASGTKTGVIDSTRTKQWTSAAGTKSVLNTYVDSENALKVSWFIKSDDSGSEIGGAAVHLENFMDGPSMTNQASGGGINAGDLQGFDYPDLNGGAPTSILLGEDFGDTDPAGRGVYEAVRYALGADSLINDWSGAETDLFSVNTDWVVTVPGQYLMTNLSAWIDSLEVDGDPCLTGEYDVSHETDEDDDDYGAHCDFRDIPLTVSAVAYDREEDEIDVDPGDIVVSPQEPDEIDPVSFEREVNVVQWGSTPVLGSARNVIIETPWAAGWANISVEANDTPSDGIVEETVDQAICDFTDYGLPLPVSCETTKSPIPLVGFAAWERNFGANPDANYGRAVDHSRVGSSFSIF